MNEYVYILILVLSNVISWILLKQINLSIINFKYIIIPTLLFSLNPIILYYALKNSNVIMINVLWSIFNMILITCVGVYFGDKLNFYNILGLILVMLSILLINKK